MSNVATAVTDTIDHAVSNVANNPDNNLTQEDAWIISDEITAELRREAKVKHATNTEKWYQSRVTVGSLSGIFSGIGGIFMVFEAQGFSAQMWPYMMAIGGGLFSLYGRWVATKPLGLGGKDD